VNVDSRLVHPVKDTLENEPGRLRSYSDTHAFTCEVCTWGELLVCSNAGRTGSSALDLPRASASAKDFLQTRPHNGFSLRCRGTSDRLLPPLPPETCTRALGSPLPDLADFRHQGETGGADVSRRPSSLRPDSLTVHFGDCSSLDDDAIEPLTPLSPARSFVPPSQATTRCSFEPRSRAPRPREGTWRRDDPRRLPSVRRSSSRTLCRSPCLPLARGETPSRDLAAGWVRRISRHFVRSAEPGAFQRRPADVHLERSPRLRAAAFSTRCEAGRMHASCFSGPRLRYRFLQHVMTRGHACEPSILFVREAVDPLSARATRPFGREAEEPCRLATSSAHFSRSAPHLSVRDRIVQFVGRRMGRRGSRLPRTKRAFASFVIGLRQHGPSPPSEGHVRRIGVPIRGERVFPSS